jgi:O-antigen/teichoic acid export membrane protein
VVFGRVGGEVRYFAVLKKVSLVSAGNIINAGFGLVFLTACARVLNVSDFGKYALLTTLLVFMSKVVDFGSNSVFVAESLKTQDRGLLIRRFYLLKIILFAAAVLLSLATLYFLGFGSFLISSIFIVGLVFYSVNVTLFAIYQASEMFAHAVLLNTIPAIFKAFLGGLMLLHVFTPSIVGVYGIFALSMGLCSVLYLFIPKEFKVTPPLSQSSKSLAVIFKTSFPAGISQLISQGWPAISNTIVKISKGFTDVGVFYLADKIANVFNLISLSIFTVILPQNARRKKENLPHDLKETAFLGILILLLAFGFVGVSGIFVTKLFGDKFSGSLLILDILIISSAISAVHAFMENYFYVHDSTKTIMYISLVKLCVFIALALALIPVLSLKGLALAQLISSLLGLVVVVLTTISASRKGSWSKA